jgi:hypothetical protein
MKLQSKDGNMVVDFYPIKTPMGNVSEEWFLKILTFMGQTQSKKFLSRIEMNLQLDDYLEREVPYKVVDFNTIPQLANPFAEV